MMNIRIPMIVLVGVLAASSHTPLKADWLFRLAFETGGDQLLLVQFDDGSEDELEAGGLAHLELGARLGFLSTSSIDTELTLGYKSDNVSAENAELRFQRVTVNAVPYLRLGQRLRFGVGVSYHTNAELEFEFDGTEVATAPFEDAVGYTAALDFAVSERFALGVRTLQIDYRVENSTEDIDGGSTGVYLTYDF